jgi:hypothetical protein
VAVSGNYAYVVDLESRLRVINISNPANPTEVGFYETTGGTSGVAVSGNYAYVADGNAGLRVINIANPAAPTEAGFCETPGWAYGVAVSSNYAYVADGVNGLRVINISNPAAPIEAGFYNTPGSGFGVAISGNYAYVADGYYFGVYDCSQAMTASDHFIPHPSSFSLSAFPNPFNAMTTIRYDVPVQAQVELRVFDVLGRNVATLMNGILTAGSHDVRFDANELSSGLYFVRLKSAHSSMTQKVMLVK